MVIRAKSEAVTAPDSRLLLHRVWCCNKRLLHPGPCRDHCKHHMRPHHPQGSTPQPHPLSCPCRSMHLSCPICLTGSRLAQCPQCHLCSCSQPAPMQGLFLVPMQVLSQHNSQYNSQYSNKSKADVQAVPYAVLCSNVMYWCHDHNSLQHPLLSRRLR